ncbi:MAG TPA: hypothetical protein DCR24_14535 [Bacillus bacterium]|nr:hypothetical protein [Bacillus sp. (in: firmicutes)]
MAMSRAIVYVGQMGADTFVQALDGVLYTEDQIGFMADRILYTEGQIGEMADRIVYVTEFTQFNTVKAMYMVMTISFMGINSMMNNMFKYAVTVNPVSYIPWLRQNFYRNPYFQYPGQYYTKE